MTRSHLDGGLIDPHRSYRFEVQSASPQAWLHPPDAIIDNIANLRTGRSEGYMSSMMRYIRQQEPYKKGG